MIDIGYVIRVIVLAWRRRAAKKMKNIWAESVVTGRCWPNDLDINMHMNNARYLREADFGRFALLLDTGLWDVVKVRRKKDLQTSLLAGAIQVQYRQSVELGDRFSITTRLAGWDERAFYIEQEITLEKNQQVACSLLVRIVVTPRSLSPQMLVEDLGYGSIESPVLPPAVENFKQNHRLTFLPLKSKL